MARIATIYRAKDDTFFVSPEFRALLGLSDGTEINPSVLAMVVHPLDRDRVAHDEFAFYTDLSANVSHAYEHRIIRQSDRAVRWMRWTLKRDVDEKGRFRSIFGTVQDITEQRKSERSVRALGLIAERRVKRLSELTVRLQETTRMEAQAVSFLRAVLDTVPQGIAVFDEDLRLAAWNSTVAGLTEIEPGQLHEGLPYKTFATRHWRHDPAASADRLRRDARGKVIEQTFEQVLSDGRTVYAAVIPRAEGRGMVKIYTDVTKHKKTEQSLRSQRAELSERVTELERLSRKLQHSNAAAEEANRSKSQFLAMMSHDIRTPMNGVLGMLATLSATELAPEQRRQLDLARQAGYQLNVLLNDILEIVRAESGKLELLPEPVNLAQTLDGIVDFWQMANTNPEIAIKVSFGGDLPKRISVDPTRFRQLIDNLLSNALKYTPEGQVTVRARSTGAALRIEVEDTGPGIPADKQADLFTDFSRLKSMTLDHTQSAGLGLAICRRLVNAMGGSIGIESEPGEGSCFWFELPLIEVVESGKPVRNKQYQRLKTADGRAPRLLVAEDVETNQLVIAGMLDLIGCDYHIVADGAAAVEAVKDDVFDLVLMDVRMPVMDGREATRVIRALPGAKAQIPIIGVTAHAQQAEQAQLVEAGMDSCVTKPIQLEVLSSRMAEVLDRSEQVPLPQNDLIDVDAIMALFEALPEARRHQVMLSSTKDLSRLLADLKSAEQAGHTDNRARAVHSLKGVAGNIGAHRLANLLADKTQVDVAEVERVVADTVNDIRHRFGLGELTGDQ
ncbi:hypothetical protein B2G71_21975 [Novosphingobium sp. PC22D]|nr:hypothetical protein B2G71_21975 [Novosphingobium sp. PC22D]